MSAGELIVRILSELKPLLPATIVIVSATVVALFYLYLTGRYTWLKSRRFPLASLFFGLDKLGTLGLACAWLKLIFPIVFVVSFQKMVLIQFLVILVPGLVIVFLSGSVAKAIGALVNLALELVGVLCASLVCGYIIDMRADTWFLLVYAAISAFLILFVIYLFLQDLERISASRSIDANLVWRTTENDDN